MFMLAMFFGVGQACLTERLVKAFNIRNTKYIGLFIAAKFILYAIGIALVVFKHVWQIGAAFCGFVVGVPIAAIVIFLYKIFLKK